MNRVYLTLCVLGVAVPFVPFIPWVLENGPDIALFVQQMFGTPIASFFSLDVIVSALAVFAASWAAHARGHRHMWLPVAGTLMVGVSLGLPLWLYLTHQHSEESAS